MTLKIRRLTSADFGRYTCLISNSEGEATYTTTLREIRTTTVPPPFPTTTTTITKRTTATSTTSTTTLKSDKIAVSTSAKTYNNYYDETVNLSAPLIIQLTPEGQREDDNGCARSVFAKAGKGQLEQILSMLSAAMICILI
ncbi:hypothetical protein SK128_001876 [Halocaridina rubra]|uniref:Immunoglobulin I-set domain-containing protein n=1 Tax=Halocaridina rubra TaxID=373956 RepID=A0AAN8X2T9_HALRR